MPVTPLVVLMKVMVWLSGMSVSDSVSDTLSVPSNAAVPVIFNWSPLVPSISKSYEPAADCVYAPVMFRVPTELPGANVPPFTTLPIMVPEPINVPTDCTVTSAVRLALTESAPSPALTAPNTASVVRSKADEPVFS